MKQSFSIDLTLFDFHSNGTNTEGIEQVDLGLEPGYYLIEIGDYSGTPGGQHVEQITVLPQQGFVTTMGTDAPDEWPGDNYGVLHVSADKPAELEISVDLSQEVAGDTFTVTLNVDPAPPLPDDPAQYLVIDVPGLKNGVAGTTGLSRHVFEAGYGTSAVIFYAINTGDYDNILTLGPTPNVTPEGPWHIAQLSAADIAGIEAALDRLSAETGLTFIRVPYEGDIEASIVLVPTTSGAAGIANLPGVTDDRTGLVQFGTWTESGDYNLLPGSDTFATFLHELGHGLGLDHSFDGTALPEMWDSRFFTIMSYEDSLNFHPDYFGPIDMAALTQIYGGGRGFDITFNGSHVRITGTSGNDKIGGSLNDDRIITGAGNDTAFGGNGNDRLFGADGHDRLFGGAGRDSLNGGAGNDFLAGDTDPYDGANDTITGGAGHDTIIGLGADDLLSGDGGRDLIKGGKGNDTLKGGRHDDTLKGGAGDDRLFGASGADVMDGQRGDDRLSAGGGRDHLRGRKGDDFLKGGSKNDTLVGDGGDDTLIGNAGADLMFGGSGNDSLNGGGGRDRLVGGPGTDTVKGGAGSDTFVFRDGDDILTIRDFDARDGGEKIDLRGVAAIEGINDITGTDAAAFQAGADVIIDWGLGEFIVLENVRLSDLDASDFLF